MKLSYKNTIIEYSVERKRIKNCYISVKDGTVRVRAPLRISDQMIEEIVVKRADWILESIEKQKKKVQIPKEYRNGEIVKILGKEAVLNVSFEKVKKAKFKYWFGQLKIVLPLEYQGNAKEQIKKVVDQFYTELAEKEVEKAMRKMSMIVGFAPNQYKIKNLRSTWGNCSISGNISINKKVVMYSRHAIEYVCLHEICHLQNMNHSKNFWDMVERYMPDYKKAERELKE